MTAFVPESGKNFKSTLLYENGFKANYIINDPVNIGKSSTGANKLRLLLPLKRLRQSMDMLQIKILINLI